MSPGTPSYKRNGLLPEDSEKPTLPTLPADLAAVRADDALLDELGDDPTPSDADVARALLAWRRDVDATPVPTLVDVDTALAIVRARSRRSLAGRLADAVRRLIGGVR